MHLDLDPQPNEPLSVSNGSHVDDSYFPDHG